MFTVMIADDEPKIREGLAQMISKEISEIVISGIAADGNELLRLFTSSPPDILLTDIRMPGIDGLSLIEACQKIKPTQKIIIISGYHDFEYARAAIRLGVSSYLVKPIVLSELKAELQSAAKQVELDRSEQIVQQKNAKYADDYFFQRLVNDELFEDEIPEDLLETHETWKNSTFRAVIIKPIGKRKEQGTPLRTALEDLFAEYGTIFAVSQGLLCLLLLKPIAQPDVVPWIQHKLTAIEKTYGLCFYVGIGAETKEIYAIGFSYHAAMLAFENSCMSDDSRIFSYDHMGEAASGYFENLFFEGDFLIDLRRGDTSAVFADLNDIFVKIQQSAIPFNVVKGMLYALYFELSKFLLEIGAIRNSILPSYLSFDTMLKKSTDAVLLKKGLCTICEKICCYVLDNAEDQGAQITEIKHFIDVHYSEDIKLHDIAESFYMNYTYLGQYFKKKTGETFNCYLNRIRVEKSKELLRGGQYSISEVAVMVGYKALNHFYRSFKQYNQINPGEYRNGLDEN